MEPSVQPAPITQPVAANPASTVTKVSSNPSDEKAGFVVRFGAFVVDELLLIVFGMLVGAIFGLLRLSAMISGLVGFFSYYVYNIFFIGTSGATPGKKFYNLKVTTVSGEKLNWGGVILRETIGKIISGLILNLGFLWVIWDKDKQGWHDKVASTYVIQTQPVGGGKKTLAYIFLFVVPILFVVGIVGAVMIALINPRAQVEKAKQQQQNSIQQQNQLIQDLYPSPTPYLP